jgi:ribonuclease HI
VITLSYKLEFETTKTIEKYEALVLGLRAAKDMAIEILVVFCDSDLIFNQAKTLIKRRNKG